MNSKQYLFWIVLVFAFVAIDQSTKYAAVSYGLPIFLNDKFAFSLPVPQFLMFCVYAVVELGIIYYVVQNFKRLVTRERLAWALIVGGSFSNIAERIIFGSVKDFIHIFNGILNAADFFILGGVAILLFGNFYLRKS